MLIWKLVGRLCRTKRCSTSVHEDPHSVVLQTFVEPPICENWPSKRTNENVFGKVRYEPAKDDGASGCARQRRSKQYPARYRVGVGKREMGDLQMKDPQTPVSDIRLLQPTIFTHCHWHALLQAVNPPAQSQWLVHSRCGNPSSFLAA